MPRAPRKLIRGGKSQARVKEEAPDVLTVAAEIKNEVDMSVKTELIDADIEDAWQPAGWQDVLASVRAMRAQRTAPVDSMGCLFFPDRPPSEREAVLEPRTVRYHHLVSLMLSAQTRDEVTAAATARLRMTLKPTLTPEAVVATPEDKLAQLIYPVGFYRRKAMFLREAARICIEKHSSDVPRTLKEITELPGVGPKMGHLLLQAAWDDVRGIGVDVHVHRLANLWRWVPEPTKTPEQTRVALEKWLPHDLWREINPLLVGFGQTWCPSRSSPKMCAQCELRATCPAVRK